MTDLATPSSAESQRASERDFAIFAWCFALAVLFQLARGDMGLFPEWNDAPNGKTFGDGPVAQLWFVAALITLFVPHRPWALVLLALTGVHDFWWRLPYMSPSLYFHAFISAQILISAAFQLVARRSLDAADLMESLRKPVLWLVIVLFSVAMFHKLTWMAPFATRDFFVLLRLYYLPFLPPVDDLGNLFSFLTISGELALPVLLFFRRTRALGILLCFGFACLVGSIVYGFGSIVIASLLPLIRTRSLLAPAETVPALDSLGRRLSPATWRGLAGCAIASLFLLDHFTGFTLADRPWLFERADRPTFLDVFTPMQVLWFAYSTTLAAAFGISVWRERQAVLAAIAPAPFVAAFALPCIMLLLEAGLYTGFRDKPNLAMFSGLEVKSCEPNHRILYSRLYTAVAHQDLLLLSKEDGERVGIPIGSLQAEFDRSRRIGHPNGLVEAFERGSVSRLRNGIEEPFDPALLESRVSMRWHERLFPQRLFFLRAVPERDLRCVMPGIFDERPATGAIEATGD